MKRRSFFARCFGALAACLGFKAIESKSQPLSVTDFNAMFDGLWHKQLGEPAMFLVFDGNGKAHLARGEQNGTTLILCENTKWIAGMSSPAI